MVQELEFFTSEFCVQDPQLTDARIYGIPLAMQGGDAGELGPRALGKSAEECGVGWFGLGSKPSINFS